MNLEPSDEQRLLAETVNDLLDKRYDASARLALLSSETGWSREMWRQYAELGLLGLAVEERYGGAGMGPAELTVVMECFGRALILEPYLATVVLGGGLIAAAGTAEQQAAVLPGMAAGDTLLAFAYAEPSSRWSLTDITTSWADGRLTGEKIAVLGGDSADQLIVTARVADGVGLFLVDADDPGLQRHGYPMQDGLRGADIVFRDATAAPLGSPHDALACIESVLDVATAALCAEAVGAMERMLWLTVDYLKTRVQFGHPIATFQTLRHRAADMYVALEQARSMALVARLAFDGDDPGPEADDIHARRTLLRAAKLQIDLAARQVGQEAVQLHGGIGMTMEYPVGHYLKRTTVISKTFADVDALTELIGAAGGLLPAG